jgi:hypothetical protein
MDGTIRVRTAAWIATAVVISVFATLLVMQEWRADAAPGDSDATWVAVEPCRLFDYRPGKEPLGGKKSPLVAGSPAIQQVTGTVGNCTIPTDGVVAVSMNVTVVQGSAQSNLRLYPADAAQEPVVSNLNWKAGDSATANKVDVKLSAAGAVKLAVANGTVNVIGDVVGFYTDSSLKELAALKVGQPFTEFNEIIEQTPLSTIEISPTKVIGAVVTAPVAGTVSVFVTAHTSEGDSPSDRADCMITTGTQLTNPFIYASPMAAGALQSIAGVRSFDVAAGSTTEFRLLWIGLGGSHMISDRTITAIFTPAP